MTLNYYTVQNGDQLFQILRRHYGHADFLNDQATLVTAVKANNPQISNIDLIYPGQVIMLPDLGHGDTGAPRISQPQAVASAEVAKSIERADGIAQSIMQQLTADKMTRTAADGFISFVEKNSAAAVDDVRQAGLAYYQLQAKTISRNQYDYRRKVALLPADAKLGIMRPLITPGKTAREAVRIDKSAAIRTHKINSEIARLDRITRLAKNGAIILKVADLANTGVQLHTASSNQERTVILLDNVGTTAGAAVGTALVTLALVGTPVGWGVIAAIAIGSVAGAAGGDALMDAIQKETLYDSDGRRINTKADRLWKAFYD